MKSIITDSPHYTYETKASNIKRNRSYVSYNSHRGNLSVKNMIDKERISNLFQSMKCMHYSMQIASRNEHERQMQLSRNACITNNRLYKKLKRDMRFTPEFSGPLFYYETPKGRIPQKIKEQKIDISIETPINNRRQTIIDIEEDKDFDKMNKLIKCESLKANLILQNQMNKYSLKNAYDSTIDSNAYSYFRKNKSNNPKTKRQYNNVALYYPKKQNKFLTRNHISFKTYRDITKIEDIERAASTQSIHISKDISSNNYRPTSVYAQSNQKKNQETKPRCLSGTRYYSKFKNETELIHFNEKKINKYMDQEGKRILRNAVNLIIHHDYQLKKADSLLSNYQAKKGINKMKKDFTFVSSETMCLKDQLEVFAHKKSKSNKEKLMKKITIARNAWNNMEHLQFEHFQHLRFKCPIAPRRIKFKKINMSSD